MTRLLNRPFTNYTTRPSVPHCSSILPVVTYTPPPFAGNDVGSSKTSKSVILLGDAFAIDGTSASSKSLPMFFATNVSLDLENSTLIAGPKARTHGARIRPSMRKGSNVSRQLPQTLGNEIEAQLAGHPPGTSAGRWGPGSPTLKRSAEKGPCLLRSVFPQ